MASNGTGDDDEIIESVIQRRLLIDGNGMGDDRKLTKLLHSFLTFFEENESTEIDDVSMEHFNWQIRELEYVAERTASSFQASERDKEEHARIGNELRTEIKRTEQLIAEYRALLVGPTSFTKVKSTVEQIRSKPDRYLSGAKIENLEKEISILKQKGELLGGALDEQKRAMTKLSSSIQVLRDLTITQKGIKKPEGHLADNK